MESAGLRCFSSSSSKIQLELKQTGPHQACARWFRDFSNAVAVFFCRHRWCANTLVGEETLVEALLNCTGGQRALEGRKQFLGLWPFRLRLRTWRFGHDCRTDIFSDQRPKAPEKKIRFFHTLLTTSNAEGRPSKWCSVRQNGTAGAEGTVFFIYLTPT